MESINPEGSVTLKFSEWFVIFDALEEWSYRSDLAGAEARMIRSKLPADALAEWNRDKDSKSSFFVAARTERLQALIDEGYDPPRGDQEPRGGSSEDLHFGSTKN